MLGILPEMGLVAIGVTILMICGEFDLSVGSVFALMPMTMAVLMVARACPSRRPLLPGSLVCAAIGFINGYVTIRFAIPSFITTLGMLFMARSLTVVDLRRLPAAAAGRRCRTGCSPPTSARASCSACRSSGSSASRC